MRDFRWYRTCEHCSSSPFSPVAVRNSLSCNVAQVDVGTFERFDDPFSSNIAPLAPHYCCCGRRKSGRTPWWTRPAGCSRCSVPSRRRMPPKGRGCVRAWTPAWPWHLPPTMSLLFPTTSPSPSIPHRLVRKRRRNIESGEICDGSC